MKKKMLLSMAAAMILGSSLTVCAAPQYMADGAVFDPEWYLEQNPDVASEWLPGTSTEAVYMHYTMYGANEGRKAYNEASLDMTGILPYQNADTAAATAADQTTNVPAPATTPNVPVGSSVTYEDTYSDPSKTNTAILTDWDASGKGNGYRRTYKYTFTNGRWVEFELRDTNDDVNGHTYVSEVTDAYGVTYREYRQGANVFVMDNVTAYMAQNPDSNFTSLLQNHGSQVVVVSADVLYDDTYDYDWNCGIIDCEPDDCIYMFVNTFELEGDPEYVADSCMTLFETVGKNFSISED